MCVFCEGVLWCEVRGVRCEVGREGGEISEGSLSLLEEHCRRLWVEFACRGITGWSRNVWGGQG